MPACIKGNWGEQESDVYMDQILTPFSQKGIGEYRDTASTKAPTLTSPFSKGDVECRYTAYIGALIPTPPFIRGE